MTAADEKRIREIIREEIAATKAASAQIHVKVMDLMVRQGIAKYSRQLSRDGSLA